MISVILLKKEETHKMAEANKAFAHRYSTKKSFSLKAHKLNIIKKI
jgi:hypothetical protein